jgi:site-specific DNA-methyltransferase (adenine-specific)
MPHTQFHNGRVVLHKGDCLEVVRTMPDNSIDSVCTDPPYALVSIVKRFGAEGAAPAQGGVYARASAGFMGKKWDTGETAFAVEFWAEILRVLKPGGHVAAFGGTRSYHRLACAIEDAGFEIRDQLAWVYGTGFPKSHDVSKGIDKAAGAEREVLGRRTDGRYATPMEVSGRSAGIMGEVVERLAPDITAPATAAARQWKGWGTALKPAWEPICLARKPLSEKTVAANVLRWGTGAINIGATRIDATDKTPAPLGCYGGSSIGPNGHSGARNGSQDSLGRFPANLCHDGSDEVLAAFPESKGQLRATGPEFERHANVYGKYAGVTAHEPRGDSGSAARFYYSAKASKTDRAGSRHPTVKPVKLMQWLVRLLTPPGGTTLDPFAGSGTTGAAAFLGGFNAVLIEREAEYQADIERRIGALEEQPVAAPDLFACA